MTYTATYSPEDNKLRLYSSSRLDLETYASVKACGFIWTPKQQLFVAPMWTPTREDFLLELCEEIGDEDTSLVERAEERAGRFEDYKESRIEDAQRAHDAVHRIADNIPFGQPDVPPKLQPVITEILWFRFSVEVISPPPWLCGSGKRAAVSTSA